MLGKIFLKKHEEGKRQVEYKESQVLGFYLSYELETPPQMSNKGKKKRQMD